MNFDHLFLYMFGQSQENHWLCAYDYPKNMTLKVLKIGLWPARDPGLEVYSKIDYIYRTFKKNIYLYFDCLGITKTILWIL